MSTDSFVSRDGADSESYVACTTAKPMSIDLSISPRALMADAKMAEAPAPDTTERPVATLVITPETVAENLRRVRDSAHNTLIRVLPDGKREYYEDRVVREGDGRIDTVRDGAHRTDRGEGVTDSLERLDNEGRIRTDKLLPGQKRDGSGRFAK